MPPSDSYRPAPRYGHLPRLSDQVEPARFPKHILRFRNQRAAAQVGLDTLSDAEWESSFARFEALPDNLPAPRALRYHGHQFMTYNPQIGDGRGFLYAQLLDDRGRLLDLGTKGSGRTMYARTADGRLTLKGGVREVLAAELLEALGVSTCRIFSLFETGEQLIRGDEPSPTRSAVMTRLSHSHVRIGTFQRLAWEEDAEAMDALLGYCVANFYPHLQGAENLPAAFLDAVAERASQTAADWMAAGFVHGVLNTDNINITGESFDYGPWRFLPWLDPSFTAAYFDSSGMYAFGRQPAAVRWSLEQLRRSLGLLSKDLGGAFASFSEVFDQQFRAAFLRRLGLASADASKLLDAWVPWASRRDVSFHRFFFDWRGGPLSEARALAGPYGEIYRSSAFAPLREQLLASTPVDGALSHPFWDQPDPCELRIEELESIWEPIAYLDQWSAFNAKIEQIRALGEAMSGAVVAGAFSEALE